MGADILWRLCNDDPAVPNDVTNHAFNMLVQFLLTTLVQQHRYCAPDAVALLMRSAQLCVFCAPVLADRKDCTT